MRIMRMLLVIDVPFYRDGLQKLLSQDDDVVVVGAVAGSDALSAVAQYIPDLVLLDTNATHARETLRELHSFAPAPRVVALAVDEQNPGIVEWLEAGVSGYVSRQSNYPELLQVLHSASRGEWVCSPRVMSFLLGRLSALKTEAVPRISESQALTPREQEILELVGRGLSNKRIANALRISHATAKNHVHHILGKLQLNSRAEVAAYLGGRSLHLPIARPRHTA
jgi:DNA-binding NarL/FixJ family response regulator